MCMLNEEVWKYKEREEEEEKAEVKQSVIVLLRQQFALDDA